jgi:hypothetical protein
VSMLIGQESQLQVLLSFLSVPLIVQLEFTRFKLTLASASCCSCGIRECDPIEEAG